MNQTIAKIIGVVGIVGGTVALMLSGSSEGMIVELVGGAFLLATLIVGVLKIGVKSE